MKDKLRILTVGGDMRSIYCAERLAEKYEVSLMGFDADNIPQGCCVSLQKPKEKADVLVLPMIPLDSDGMIVSKFGECVSPDEIVPLLKDDAKIFTGRMDERLRELFPLSNFVEYLSCEDVCLKNAIPTAEGAVQIALAEIPETLNGLKVLIVGMGRIGTALAEILKGFGADVTAALRNEKGAANARLHGIKSIRTENITNEYRLIFNTVPSLIFDREKLAELRSDTLIIDLASKPFGVDYDAAKILGIRALQALGLPGKTAPVTAGRIIAECITDNLSKGGGGNV